MGNLILFVRAVWYWVDAQIRPIDKVTAREMKFVGDVEGHCEMCLLVEEDETKRVSLELMLGRVTEIRTLVKKYCRKVRRAMAARPAAIVTGNWAEFETRVLAEVEVLEELSSKILQLRALNPEVSVLHMRRDSKIEPITTPRG